MPTTFRPYQPDQDLLFPPSLRDWLPEGHFANHVSDLVDGLDLTVFYEPYEGDGRRKSPYEPRMMVKLLLSGSMFQRQSALVPVFGRCTGQD